MKDHRLFTPGFALMILSALAFASTSVAIKPLSLVLPPTQIIFAHFVVGALVLGPALFLKGSGLQGKPSWLLILRGLCGTISFFFFLRSLTLIPLSNTIVLFYTYPVFVVLFSSFLLKSAIGKKDLILILTGMTGTTILINPSFHSFNEGYIYALLASAIEAISIVIVRKAMRTNNPFIIYFYFCVTGGMLCLPFSSGFRVPDLHGGFLLGFSALASLVAQVLMNQGFKFCGATEGSLILMSEVAFVGTAGILIFNDPVTFGFVMGAFLIVASGVGLNSIHGNARDPSVREVSQPPPVNPGKD